MDLVVSARNMELSAVARSVIQRKFGTILRQFRDYNDPAEAKIEVRRESTRSAQHQMVVQITVNLAGTLLRAEERAPTVNIATDAAVHALEQQVKRFKGRHFVNIKAKRGSTGESIRETEAARANPEPAAGEDEELATPSGKVVRVKRFAMKPIAVEEAATQMELLGHEFFFFLNGETGQHNVLYRRKDGDYTVIEPAQM